MKVQIISDLHLDINKLFLTKTFPLYIPEDSKDIVLIIAGDVGNSQALKFCLSFYADVYKAVIFVYGNHEYYNQSFVSLRKDTESFFHKFKSNVFFLEKKSIVLDDVVFLGATGWSPALDIPDIQKYSNDFKFIEKFTKKKCQDEFLKTKNWLKSSLEFFSGKKVIFISHFSFCSLSIPKKYLDSKIVSYYVQPVLDEIEVEYLPLLYVHGHVHEQFSYKFKERMNVVCNPYGYHREIKNDEEQNHKFSLIIDLDEI